jgi:hypothetical protein
MGQTHVGSQINSQIHMMAYTLVLVLGSHWLLSMCGALAQSTLLAIFGDSVRMQLGPGFASPTRTQQT